MSYTYADDLRPLWACRPGDKDVDKARPERCVMTDDSEDNMTHSYHAVTATPLTSTDSDQNNNRVCSLRTC